MDKRPAPTEVLTNTEKLAFNVCSAANHLAVPKRVQSAYLKHILRPLARAATGKRAYVHGGEWLEGYQPTKGLVLAANHRSFFDLYMLMLSVWEMGHYWYERIYFPVRAPFFYDQRAGLLTNILLGGCALYPPLFREAEKRSFNQYSVEILTEILGDPHSLVGIHPEGTRNKGEDPYKLLRAQPGVGQIILSSTPVVVPAFVNGLGNSVGDVLRTNLRSSSKRDEPIVVVLGEPLDYSEFSSQTPRLSVYKRCADFVLQEVAKLGEKEREIRAQIRSGEISPDHPNWLVHRSVHIAH